MLLSIKDLSVSIEDKQILNNLSLDINAGEVHAIMGPNGSGKSTLSKILAGHPAYKSTAGTVTYNGKDLLECVEISSKPGLLQIIQADGEPKRFQAQGKDCKIMDVITVDSKGEETTMHRLNIPEDEDA